MGSGVQQRNILGMNLQQLPVLSDVYNLIILMGITTRLAGINCFHHETAIT